MRVLRSATEMRRSTQPFRPEAPSRAELAAGAVVLDPGSGDVLLLHHAAEDRWCLPKGHVEPGESLRAAALREVLEETGLERVDLGDELGEVHYRFFDPARSENSVKTTVYFLARSAGRSPHLEPTFDTHVWLPLQAALDRVPFDTDRAILERVRVPNDLSPSSSNAARTAVGSNQKGT